MNGRQRSYRPTVVEALEEPRHQVTGYNQRGALRRGRRQPAIGPAAIQQRA